MWQHGSMSTLHTDRVACGDAGEMDLHIWTPDAPPRAAVLLVQEIFGVGAYIRAVAERLAAAGYLVGAPDVFWRFAPNWAAGHDQAGLDASLEQVGRLDFPAAVGDLCAALDHLAATPGIGDTDLPRIFDPYYRALAVLPRFDGRFGEAIAGREGFVLNVEHAGHAFDNHESEIFYDEAAAKAAWAKTMAFLSLYLPA